MNSIKLIKLSDYIIRHNLDYDTLIKNISLIKIMIDNRRKIGQCCDGKKISNKDQIMCNVLCPFNTKIMNDYGVEYGCLFSLLINSKYWKGRVGDNIDANILLENQLATDEVKELLNLLEESIKK